jgi:Tol biopolymer transport system component
MQHDLDQWDEGNYFLLPAAGGDFTPLTGGPGYKSNPGWSPDGRHLALVLTDSTGSRLVLTDRSGQQLSVGSTPIADHLLPHNLVGRRPNHAVSGEGG